MLEQAQINAITIYCEKRGVKYYDVQLELVDHIADIIEDLQKTNPVLSFSEALELAGEQFSIDEFKYIVRSKKDHIEKNISRLIENEFLTFFTIPKIIVTITLFFVAYFVPIWMHTNKALCVIVLVLTVVPFFFYVINKYYLIDDLKDKRNSAFKLLSYKAKSRYEIIVMVCMYSINIFFNVIRVFFDWHIKSDMISQLILFFLVILGILSAAMYEVRFQFNRKMKAQYPKAFTS